MELIIKILFIGFMCLLIFDTFFPDVKKEKSEDNK
jgi:hypothetical protein